MRIALLAPLNNVDGKDSSSTVQAGFCPRTDAPRTKLQEANRRNRTAPAAVDCSQTTP